MEQDRLDGDTTRARMHQTAYHVHGSMVLDALVTGCRVQRESNDAHVHQM